MKKIYEFLNHFWDKGSSAAVVPEEDNRDAVKMPLFKIVFGPEGLFIDRTRNFFAVAGIYGSAVVGFVFGCRAGVYVPL